MLRIRHAWSSYKTHAWGNDELLPIAGKPEPQRFGVQGVDRDTGEGHGNYFTIGLSQASGLPEV